MDEVFWVREMDSIFLKLGDSRNPIILNNLNFINNLNFLNKFEIFPDEKANYLEYLENLDFFRPVKI